MKHEDEEGFVDYADLNLEHRLADLFAKIFTIYLKFTKKLYFCGSV